MHIRGDFFFSSLKGASLVDRGYMTVREKPRYTWVEIE